MEGIIKIGDGTAGRGISIQASGFLALLGTAVLLNQAYPGMEGKTADGQITKIESEGIAGTIVKVWNPDDRVHVLKDAEGSVLKKLLTQDGPAADLIHAADSGSDRALILPDLSDGDVWGAIHQETLEGAQDGWVAADSAALEKPSISGGLSDGEMAVDLSAEEIPADVGTAVNPVKPVALPDTEKPADSITAEFLSGEGAVSNPAAPAFPSRKEAAVNPAVPKMPGREGNIVDPMIPETPGKEGIVVDPMVPDTPADEGTAVDPIVPDTPADEGTAIDPIIPEVPPAGENAVDPIVPDTPAVDGEIVTPAVPDQGSSDPAEGDGTVPDTGDEDAGDPGAASCFLLDEMGMLCSFLPEYAEIPDGCLTLPAECTGIRRGAFSGCGEGILELYIPAGAVTIEEGALADLIALEWIDVESGNPGYVSDGGVLFDSTMSVLLAFPAAWTDVYAVPPGVVRIADRAFDGASIYRLDIRDCAGLSFGQNVFGNSGGTGIQVAVPEPEMELYAERLAEYEITLTK
nr:hypothetical protein [uncultured Schaedlerella sp.]